MVLSALIITFAMSGNAADIAERASIKDQYKWDLSVMYPSASAWDKHYQEVDALIGRLAALLPPPHRPILTGGGGFLWKPVSHAGHTLVVLVPGWMNPSPVFP